MGDLPTIAINREGERVLINASDFVEGVHSPWVEPAAKAAEQPTQADVAPQDAVERQGRRGGRR